MLIAPAATETHRKQLSWKSLIDVVAIFSPQENLSTWEQNSCMERHYSDV